MMVSFNSFWSRTSARIDTTWITSMGFHILKGSTTSIKKNKKAISLIWLFEWSQTWLEKYPSRINFSLTVSIRKPSEFYNGFKTSKVNSNSKTTNSDHRLIFRFPQKTRINRALIVIPMKNVFRILAFTKTNLLESHTASKLIYTNQPKLKIIHCFYLELQKRSISNNFYFFFD